MRRSFSALLPLLMLALAARPASAADYVVVVDKMAFGALPAQLHVGDTITWKNDDLFRHTVTARDRSFDVDLPVKSEVVMPLTAAGQWDFICKFHPGMTGTLTVLP
nr:cupredoxin domain-containing protein [uncultured Devosia sp.]